MPTRSSGCAACRKRKIRCDERRPACQKCVTHGISCPGYRTNERGGLEFMDQTTWTVKRAKKKYSTNTWNLTESSPSTSPRSDTTSTPDILQYSSPGTSMVVRASTTSPIEFLSPAMNRSQLWCNFIDIYLPKSAPIDHYTLFRDIIATPSDHPSLTKGLDALSLITFAWKSKDQTLAHHAVQSYAQALKCLAKSIAHSEYMYNDDVLAAVTILANCEFYDEIAQTGQGWAKHVSGTQQLFAARGPDSFQSPRSLLLFSNSRYAALAHGLIQRKELATASPQWREVAFRCSNQDNATLFYDLAIQVPGLLERHDGLVSNRGANDVEELLNEYRTIKNGLSTWFTNWQSSAHATDQSLFETKPIEDFPTFTSLCSDHTFAEAFWFVNFPTGYLAAMYWLCMHALQTDIQSLQQMSRSVSYPGEQQQVRESELYSYATNLCKCIPFFCEPVSSNAGSIAIFLPMRTAAMYFVKERLSREAKWVGAVRNSVFVHGMSPPNVRDPPGTISNLDRDRVMEVD